MISPIYKEVGAKLRSLRKTKGMTQGEIGRILGISRVSVTNIEKGKHKVQLHLLYDYSKVLGVSINEIIS